MQRSADDDIALAQYLYNVLVKILGSASGQGAGACSGTLITLENGNVRCGLAHDHANPAPNTADSQQPDRGALCQQLGKLYSIFDAECQIQNQPSYMPDRNIPPPIKSEPPGESKPCFAPKDTLFGIGSMVFTVRPLDSVTRWESNGQGGIQNRVEPDQEKSRPCPHQGSNPVPIGVETMTHHRYHSTGPRKPKPNVAEKGRVSGPELTQLIARS